jgi:hypothetical protein
MAIIGCQWWQEQEGHCSAKGGQMRTSKMRPCAASRVPHTGQIKVELAHTLTTVRPERLAALARRAGIEWRALG